MFRVGFVFGFSLLCTVFSCQKFPSDIHRCKYSDSECISEVVTKILREYSSKGHRGLNIVPIDPFHVESMELEKVPGSPVNVQLKFKDIDLTGIRNGTVLKVTGFKKEASDLTFEMKVNYPKFVISGPYSIEGRVLTVPIKGQGNGKITFDDVFVIGRAKCTKRQKDGEAYLNIADAELEIQPKKLIFALENNNNKALGDKMNRVLNDNWEAVFLTLKPMLEKAFAKVGAYVANGTFSTIPYADLFLSSA